MNKAALFFGATTFVLLLILSLQLPKLYAAQAAQEEAQQLATSARRLIKASNIPCSASPSDIEGMAGCINKALQEDDFVTTSFTRYDERKNESGALIISNKGIKTYSGAEFILSKNGVPISKGCHIEGDILPDYSCRFSIDSPCERGDVFTISYEEGRLVTETC